MSLLRITFFMVCLCGAYAAFTQADTPWGVKTFAPPDASSPLSITPVVAAHGVSWEGRELLTIETGAYAEWKGRYSLGISSMQDSGHGRSYLDTYDGDGWHAWAGVKSRREIDSRVSFGATIDRTADDVYIYASGTNSRLESWTSYEALGLRVDGKVKRGDVTFHALSGFYDVKVNADHFATVGMVGAGATIPVAKNTHAYAQLSGFKDDHGGRFFSYEMKAGLSLVHGNRGSVTLGGSYYPHGVPLAGTPFSSASAVGITLEDDSIGFVRGKSFGNLSLCGQIYF